MGWPKARFEAGGEVLVDQDGVDASASRARARAGDASKRRNAGKSVSRRHRATRLRHEAFDQREHAVGAIDEAFERGAPIGGARRAVLVEPGLGARGIVRRRQPQQRQEIAALEMRAFLLELRAPLCVD